MTKPKLNYLIDFISALVFMILSFSAIILFFSEKRIRGGGNKLILGILRKNWVSIHDIFGLVFIGLIIIHLILHWKWIKSVTLSFFKK